MSQRWRNFSSPWGAPHQHQAPNFTASSKSISPTCSSTNWWPNICILPKPHPFPGYVTCISKCQPHGFSNASFTWPHTAEVGCFVVGVITTSTDTKSPLLLSHCPRQPAASLGSVPVLAELPATYTAWNPGWKDGVLMFVAPWGIPGQAQLNS